MLDMILSYEYMIQVQLIVTMGDDAPLLVPSNSEQTGRAGNMLHNTYCSG